VCKCIGRERSSNFEENCEMTIFFSERSPKRLQQSEYMYIVIPRKLFGTRKRRFVKFSLAAFYFKIFTIFFFGGGG